MSEKLQILTSDNVLSRGKRRATVFSLLVLSICITGMAQGQSGRGAGYAKRNRRDVGPSSLDRRVKRLGDQLNLNDVQRFDVKKLLQSQQGEVTQLWNDQDMNPMDRVTKLRAIHEDTQKRFHALLTPDQREKYDSLLKEAEARRAAAAPQVSTQKTSTQQQPPEDKEKH